MNIKNKVLQTALHYNPNTQTLFCERNGLMAKQTTKKNGSTINLVMLRKLKALKRLCASGVDTGEKLQQMTAKDVVELFPEAMNDDVRMMLDIQFYDKAGTLFSYLCTQ